MRKSILLTLGAVCLMAGLIWFVLDQSQAKGYVALFGAAAFLIWASLRKLEVEVPSVFRVTGYATVLGVTSFILWELGFFHWLGKNMAIIPVFVLFGAMALAPLLNKKI